MRRERAAAAKQRTSGGYGMAVDRTITPWLPRNGEATSIRLTKSYRSSGKARAGPRPNLPFTREGWSVTSSSVNYGNVPCITPANSEAWKTVGLGRYDPPISDLTDRLNSKVYSSQSWGESALQGGKTLSSAKKLFDLAMATKRGNWGKIPGLLGMKPKGNKYHWTPPKGVQGADAVAGAWLEYSYGWAPLASDVFSTAETAVKRLWEYIPEEAFDETAINWQDKSGQYFATGGYHGTANVRRKVGAVFRISNRTLYTLQSLGILNPALVAWQVTPFSHMVDWFWNVSSFLNSFTQWSGVELVTGYSTRFAESEFSGQEGPLSGAQKISCTGDLYSCRRTLWSPGSNETLPGVHLPAVNSWKRAANMLTNTHLVLASTIGRRGHGV